MQTHSDKLKDFALEISILFDKHLQTWNNEKHIQNLHGWKDDFWNSDLIEKCHLKTIDLLEERKLWLLHLNIFPRPGWDLPILGCDIVAGPNKISGAFFDFSPVVHDDHPLCVYFNEETKRFTWKKPRELPDWAKEIFSDHMMAVGNVREEETDQFLLATKTMICYYLENMNKEAVQVDFSTREILNKYCFNQKKNLQLHNSIISMGVSLEDKDYYVNNVLFEEIEDAETDISGV
jgi:phycocyanobilin:ferredoxin oxidoreductase